MKRSLLDLFSPLPPSSTFSLGIPNYKGDGPVHGVHFSGNSLGRFLIVSGVEGGGGVRQGTEYVLLPLEIMLGYWPFNQTANNEKGVDEKYRETIPLSGFF